jgi:carbon-monoxide dehydrogenase medium subunit
MFPASFSYVPAVSVEEAIALLRTYGEDAKLLAGGHSLIPAMKLRLATPQYLIDLGTVPGLSNIRVIDESLAIGAMTVHADVATSELVCRYLPGLAEAALSIGDVQVRNRGTIGGSVAHADPAADFPVILSALDASFELVSSAGKRTVTADQFFVDFFTTALAPDEVLTEIRMPLPPAGTGTAYEKLGHPASGYVVVSAGAQVRCQASGQCVAAWVAIGGLGGGPYRATHTEVALQGQALTPDVISAAAALAAEGVEADDDPYASADYKRHMVTVYARRAIASAVQRATG